MLNGTGQFPYITKGFPQVLYKDANQAFEFLVEKILSHGEVNDDSTIRLENIGFYMANPTKNEITTEWRKWSRKYAEREWNWYMSHSRDVSELQKHAPTWKKMHGGDCQVNSNYGWQWSRNKQLEKAIKKLNVNPSTRQAWITLYDGKEQDDYEYDAPCTLNVGFKIENALHDPDYQQLDMTVIMRSCDLIFGFCNDQYSFSQLQKYVASKLNINIGVYYHFAQDLHIYLPCTSVYPDFINEHIKSELEKR